MKAYYTTEKFISVIPSVSYEQYQYTEDKKYMRTLYYNGVGGVFIGGFITTPPNAPLTNLIKLLNKGA